LHDEKSGFLMEGWVEEDITAEDIAEKVSVDATEAFENFTESPEGFRNSIGREYWKPQLDHVSFMAMLHPYVKEIVIDKEAVEDAIAAFEQPKPGEIHKAATYDVRNKLLLMACFVPDTAAGKNARLCLKEHEKHTNGRGVKKTGNKAPPKWRTDGDNNTTQENEP